MTCSLIEWAERTDSNIVTSVDSSVIHEDGAAKENSSFPMNTMRV